MTGRCDQRLISLVARGEAEAGTQILGNYGSLLNWRSVYVNFIHHVKTIFSIVQSSPQIVEILGLEVTLAFVQCQINSVESSSSISPILSNVTLTVDAAPTWKSFSRKLPCSSYGIPILHDSVCYEDDFFRDDCSYCGYCITVDERILRPRSDLLKPSLVSPRCSLMKLNQII